MKEKLIAALIEIVGISVTSIGVGYEAAYKADLGYLIITVGSIIIATGGLIYAKILPKG